MENVLADVNQDVSFGNSGVTLTLMLRRAAGVSYAITSNPHAQIVPSNVNVSASYRLLLSYNTEYDVSIIATVCRLCNVSKIIMLKYGEYDCFFFT